MDVSDASFIRSWKQGMVAYVQLCRPQKANAYDQSMLTLLAAEWRALQDAEDIRVMVLCSSGSRSFCAGADLNEVKGKDYRAALDLRSAHVFDLIASCPKVTIAAINGAAVAGGLEMALACDLRIAVGTATFSFPETALGLIPAAGGTHRLPEIVGVGHAKELILGGRVWSAKEALQYGLVGEVVKADELMDRAQARSEQIARRDPLALRLAKQAITLQDTSSVVKNFPAVAEALLYQLRSDPKNR